jgi:hypothetical protein
LEALCRILPGGSEREKVLEGYRDVRRRLGAVGAPRHAAALILQSLK